MIDVNELQNELILHPEHIATVYESLGYQPKDRGKYYNFPHKDGNNPNAISIVKSTLRYTDFSHGGKGNIFTFVQSELNTSFPNALEYIASKIGFKGSNYTKAEIKYPFGHFYKDLVCSKDGLPTLKSYSEDDLPSPKCLSAKWFKAGVSYKFQEYFDVRLDIDSNRIVIPIYDLNGNLVGAKGRNNDDNCPSDKRWSMFIPYAKSQVVYGLNFNYKSIIEKNALIIFEAEKSVQLCAEFGMYCTCAIGGHSLSDTQVKIINSLMVDKIIVAFDEGICEEECEYESKKLIVDSKIYHNKVGYIYDKENKYLAKKSKDSPADLGGEILSKMIKKNVVWL